MSSNLVFSWAEDINGKLVHVDTVTRGLQCQCVCPHCHESLLARHGEVKEHGFAHHSDNRRANLNICYQVTLYKLAEHIIQDKKCVFAPSYYGIYKAKLLKFEDVQIDCRYEREDKQPDIIATTVDGIQYLIEFVFSYKVQHKQALDYRNMVCIEIDLSNQTLDTLDFFLLNSTEDKRWLNNIQYFEGLETLYHNANKLVRVIDVDMCRNCKLSVRCCAVKIMLDVLTIVNNGKQYRLCKIDEYQRQIEILVEHEAEQKHHEAESEKLEQLYESYRLGDQEHNELLYKQRQQALTSDIVSCFNCERNLLWANRDGQADCGSWLSLRTPKRPSPKYAEKCRSYKKKQM
jgi:hypothetical protein